MPTFGGRNSEKFSMKKDRHIKFIASAALAAVLVLQALWLTSMFRYYRAEYLQTVNNSLQEAVDMELTARKYSLKGGMSYWFKAGGNDTSRMVRKKLMLEDTTINIYYDKYEPHVLDKIEQTAMQFLAPLNVRDLDSIFRQQMTANHYPVTTTYTEYHSMAKNRLIAGSQPVRPETKLYASELLPIDIHKTLGVQVYSEIPALVVLKKMIVQFLLSAILIAAAAFCMFRLLQTIARQRKEAKVRRDFIDAMTHEFKRPVTASLTAAEVMDETGEDHPERIKKYIGIIRLELQKLQVYTRTIREIERGKAGVTVLEKEEIALRPLLDDLQKRYTQTGEKRVIPEIVMNGDETLYADLLHFSNIMDNLTENAVKYSGEEVHILITVKRENGKITIGVRDNGWGIAAKELPHIFDAFYRGKSSEKRKQQGFGLGLSYVKMMTEAMGGTIRVSGEEGKYTEAVLCFDAPVRSELSEKERAPVSADVRSLRIEPTLQPSEIA